MNPLRDRWFEQTLTRENRIVDSALLSNLMNSATFFLVNDALALGGLMALFGSVEERRDHRACHLPSAPRRRCWRPR